MSFKLKNIIDFKYKKFMLKIVTLVLDLKQY